MPFPVDEKYIIETESELSVKFPTDFKKRMMEENGGEIESEDFYFQIHPFFDKSDKKRISRTCNHIGLETKNARQWNDFPENGIVIGDGGSGDLIFLQHNGDGILTDEVYLWDHGEIEKIAETINEFD
ncbi:SMI1/KNR4 family protein [Winogradskyella tangerina]|uniref:SMI1/KNR4 family protein n=1 Tax=Winogradskyella tangerina TaxID=2023240 RepID=UPI000DBE549B|nr:SMI1/KNR4 family protein [Winogradskyella tangerina]